MIKFIIFVEMFGYTQDWDQQADTLEEIIFGPWFNFSFEQAYSLVNKTQPLIPQNSKNIIVTSS